MNKIIKNNIVLFISLFLFSLIFIIPVSANINLTFQSDNEKVIKIINIDNNYTATSSNTNITNQSINLTYNNYLIKLYSSNTELQTGNNATTILLNMRVINNDRYTLIWIVIILALIVFGIRYFTA